MPGTEANNEYVQQLHLHGAGLDEPVPPGFHYLPGFITGEEEENLLAFARGLGEMAPYVLRGQASHRRVKLFGAGRYRDAPGPPPAFPEELRWLRLRLAAAADTDPETFTHALVTYYPRGSQIGWHRDAPQFGEPVMGVSLLGSAVMLFRRRGEREQPKLHLALEPRSGYLIAGAARWDWEHHIPALKSERWSVTFRTTR